MKMDSYPTPSQITVSLGSVWIDDALRIEFKEEAAKVPIFGYNERQANVFADGHSYVSGSLVINYRFPGYMLWAARQDKERLARVQEAASLVTKIRNATVAERVNLLDEARQEGVEDELAAIMRKAIIGNEKSLNIIPSIMDESATKNYKIKIWFDTPEQSLYHRSINGVRFTGRSLAANNSVNAGADTSASGMPLLEIYTFIARDVSDIRSAAIDVERKYSSTETLHSLPSTDAGT